MKTSSAYYRGFCLWLVIVAASSAVGCRSVPQAAPAGSIPDDLLMRESMPRELSKTTLPTYVIEPPDILIIEAIHLVPRPPYRLRTSDEVVIQVKGTLPDAPIFGEFVVEPGGIVNLGQPYGTVPIAGLTSEEAQQTIQKYLTATLREPQVAVSLLRMSGLQHIAGEHLVTPDGTVTLGSYGSVSVIGKTLAEAKRAIEAHLSRYLEHPEVAIDVYAYNSKVYYLIFQGAGTGDKVWRFPITGNETVLDALASEQLNRGLGGGAGGLTALSSTRMWIARPTPNAGSVQILPVDWEAITAQGAIATNYQLMPGDRLFVAENKLVAADTAMAKLFAPMQRMMTFSTQGVDTVSRFSGSVLQGGGLRGVLTGGVQ